MEKCVLGKYILEAYEKHLDNIIKSHAPNRFPKKRKSINLGLQNKRGIPQQIEKNVSVQEYNKRADLIGICQCLLRAANAQSTQFHLLSANSNIPSINSSSPAVNNIDTVPPETRRAYPIISEQTISMDEIDNFLRFENENQQLQDHFRRATNYILEHQRGENGNILQCWPDIQTRPIPIPLPPSGELGERRDPISRYCARYPLPPPPPIQRGDDQISLAEREHRERFRITSITNLNRRINEGRRRHIKILSSFFANKVRISPIMEDNCTSFINAGFSRFDTIPENREWVVVSNTDDEIYTHSQPNPRDMTDSQNAAIHSNGNLNMQVVNTAVSGTESRNVELVAATSSILRYINRITQY